VLVDDVFTDPEWLDGWRGELVDLELLLVGVVVPLRVLEERESARAIESSGRRVLRSM
jgi:chloramphenicol 3-O-phosphotransferase